MTSEHVDVLIVGAGISGIGAGYHLQANCPGKTYAILERRENIGGTWDLFRYPGIRSDSDMHTLGFSFRPWTAAKAIADGPAILDYLADTMRAYGIERHIRFGHHVKSASWNSETATWTVTALRDGKPAEISCNFLFMCSGYYSYDAGYTPDWDTLGRFGGRVVHPQHWPDDLDYSGKRVVVIGSGATAVTLVPAMTDRAAHVTMLQRSPTYMVSRPSEDRIANGLRRFLPAKLAYGITRWKNVTLQQFFFKLARNRPEKVREKLIDAVRGLLKPGYDVETHFTPRYNPWDQRLCLVPDADMFEALNAGKASIVTDTIAAFDEKGIQLSSGARLDADIVVTATGLNLQFMSDLAVTVDGEPAPMPGRLGYKGMMYADVPNLATSFGYTNASWTLKADLTCEYVCRLINHMDKTGTRIATPRVNDPEVTPVEWIDFSSGYFARALHMFPKQGSKMPWKLNQNYAKDLLLLKYGKLEDGAMEFARPHKVEHAAAETERTLEAA